MLESGNEYYTSTRTNALEARTLCGSLARRVMGVTGRETYSATVFDVEFRLGRGEGFAGPAFSF